jgi:hypothetical protein
MTAKEFISLHLFLGFLNDAFMQPVDQSGRTKIRVVQYSEGSKRVYDIGSSHNGEC